MRGISTRGPPYRPPAKSIVFVFICVLVEFRLYLGVHVASRGVLYNRAHTSMLKTMSGQVRRATSKGGRPKS